MWEKHFVTHALKISIIVLFKLEYVCNRVSWFVSRSCGLGSSTKRKEALPLYQVSIWLCWYSQVLFLPRRERKLRGRDSEGYRNEENGKRKDWFLFSHIQTSLTGQEAKRIIWMNNCDTDKMRKHRWAWGSKECIQRRVKERPLSASLIPLTPIPYTTPHSGATDRVWTWREILQGAGRHGKTKHDSRSLMRILKLKKFPLKT